MQSPVLTKATKLNLKLTRLGIFTPDLFPHSVIFSLPVGNLHFQIPPETRELLRRFYSHLSHAPQERVVVTTHMFVGPLKSEGFGGFV